MPSEPIQLSPCFLIRLNRAIWVVVSTRLVDQEPQRLAPLGTEKGVWRS